MLDYIYLLVKVLMGLSCLRCCYFLPYFQPLVKYVEFSSWADGVEMDVVYRVAFMSPRSTTRGSIGALDWHVTKLATVRVI